MNGKRWGLITTLLIVLVVALSGSPVFGEPKPDRGKGKGGDLTGDLDVSITVIAADRPHIDVSVVHDVVGAVEEATVVLTITDVSDGSVFTLKKRTDGSGVAHFEKKGKGGSDESGTFNIHATATKDDAGGTDCVVVSVDVADFLVTRCPG